MTVPEIVMAGAGVVAASSCCAASSLRRARGAAIVMALACLPVADVRWTLATGIALIVASILLAVGARSRAPTARSMDLHRALGGTLMGGMVLLGEHSVGAAGAHQHGVPAHALIAAGGIVFLIGTCALLNSRAHAHSAAERIELIAMVFMFAAMLVRMGTVVV